MAAAHSRVNRGAATLYIADARISLLQKCRVTAFPAGHADSNAAAALCFPSAGRLSSPLGASSASTLTAVSGLTVIKCESCCP